MPAARAAVDPPTGARERELLGRVRTLRGRPPTRRGDGLVSTDAPDTDDPRIDALLIQHAYIERCDRRRTKTPSESSESVIGFF